MTTVTAERSVPPPGGWEPPVTPEKMPGLRALARRQAGRKMRWVRYQSNRRGTIADAVNARRRLALGLPYWEGFFQRKLLQQARERKDHPVTDAGNAVTKVPASRPHVTLDGLRRSWREGGVCGHCGKILEDEEPVTAVRYVAGRPRNAVICNACVDLGSGWWAKQRLLGVDAYTRDARVVACKGWDVPLHTFTGKDGNEHSFEDWHAFLRDVLQHVIPFAPCEGCGRPVRTARRFLCEPSPRVEVHHHLTDEELEEKKAHEVRIFGSVIFARQDWTTYELAPDAYRFTACSRRCVTAVRRGRGRESEPLICNGCGEVIDAARSDARYCSSACRQKAYRARRITPARS